MNHVKNTKKILPIEFLWLALYTFAGFSFELLLSVLINVMGIKPLTTENHLIITSILWLVFSLFLIYISKNKFNFDVFKFKVKLSRKALIINLFSIGLIIIITTILFKGFKPYMEFIGGSQGNVYSYFLQLIYYACESLLIVLCIVFAQKYFEDKLSVNPKIPVGGIFLAITWGIVHIFLQGLSGGIFAMFFSVIAGVTYINCQKDFKWSYIFIALAFIL